MSENKTIEKQYRIDVDRILAAHNEAGAEWNQRQFCEHYGITLPTFHNMRTKAAAASVQLIIRAQKETGLYLEEILTPVEE